MGKRNGEAKRGIETGKRNGEAKRGSETGKRKRRKKVGTLLTLLTLLWAGVWQCSIGMCLTGINTDGTHGYVSVWCGGEKGVGLERKGWREVVEHVNSCWERCVKWSRRLSSKFHSRWTNAEKKREPSGGVLKGGGIGELVWCVGSDHWDYRVDTNDIIDWALGVEEKESVWSEVRIGEEKTREATNRSFQGRFGV